MSAVATNGSAMTRPSLSDSAATGRWRSSPTSVDPLGGSVKSSSANRSSASRSFAVAGRTAIDANNGRKGVSRIRPRAAAFNSCWRCRARTWVR